MARESAQEKATVRLLESLDFVARKDGRDGWPDRLVLMGRNRHCWIEHKTDRGRLTPAQRRVFPKLEERGDLIIYGKGKTALEIANEVMAFARPGFAR